MDMLQQLKISSLFFATEKSTGVDATGLGSLLAQMKGGHYMRKMFKKVVGAVMAAAMVVTTATGLGTPAVSSAADVYALPVPVSYDNVCEKDEWWDLSQTSLGFDIAPDLVAKGSTEFKVGFTISVPKFLFSDKNNRLKINANLGLSDTGENGEYIGSLDSVGEIKCENKKGNFEFRMWDEEAQQDVLLNDNATVTSKGDFYQITMKDIKLRSDFWEDVPVRLDTSKEYRINGNISFGGIHMTGDTIIYVDKFSLSDGDNLIAESAFDKESGFWYGINSKDEGEGTAIVKSDSLLKVAKTSLTVKKGKTVSIKATAAAGPKTSVKYTSSNKKIATVTSKGVVKGVKPGKAVITVKANGVSKKVTVTVKK